MFRNGLTITQIDNFKNKRIDGRNLDEIRSIHCDVGILPRVHGSSLFTRGEPQAIVVATLGGKRDEQMMDNIEGLSYKRFMFHYNFPSYCVGEARGKFNQIAGPQGGTTLNGAELKQTGTAEMEKLDIEINNYQEGGTPHSFVIG